MSDPDRARTDEQDPDGLTGPPRPDPLSPDELSPDPLSPDDETESVLENERELSDGDD